MSGVVGVVSGDSTRSRGVGSPGIGRFGGLAVYCGAPCDSGVRYRGSVDGLEGVAEIGGGRDAR